MLIVDELTLSAKTVSTYRTRILEKLGVKNSAAIVQYAMRNDSTPAPVVKRRASPPSRGARSGGSTANYKDFCADYFTPAGAVGVTSAVLQDTGEHGATPNTMSP